LCELGVLARSRFKSEIDLWRKGQISPLLS
jgi:hypothetical protein